MIFTCPYFSPEVMLKFTRRVRGYSVILIEIGMRLIQWNPWIYVVILL